MEKINTIDALRITTLILVISAVTLSLSSKIESFAWGAEAFAIVSLIELSRLMAGAWLAHPSAGLLAKCVAGFMMLLIAPLSLAVTMLSPTAGRVPIAAWAALEVLMSLGLPLALLPRRAPAEHGSMAPATTQISKASRPKAGQRSRGMAGVSLAAAPPRHRPAPLPAAKRLVAAFARDQLRTQAGAVLPHSSLRRRLDAYAALHQLPMPTEHALGRALLALGYPSRRGLRGRIEYLNLALADTPETLA